MSILCSALLAVRAVLPAGPGPNRLDADVALLTAATPELRDLRLADAQGREVPYLLVAPRGREPVWVSGRAIPIAATKTTSGFELDLGESREVDRLALDGIAAPFLKRVRLEGSGDRARWTLLADGTVFDLPDEKLRHTEIEFGAGAYRYLRLTWDDRASAPVRVIPAARARIHASDAPPPPLGASIPFIRRASEPGKSRYRLDLPAARLPIDAVEVVVSQGNVYRAASVSEARLGNGEASPWSLGRAVLHRSERGDAVAADLRIPVSRPQERRLDLVIEDAGNPPLAIEAIVARLAPQPWIYFESADGAPIIARYGDARLTAPRYDLEASRTSIEEKTLPAARWGAPRETTAPSATAEEFDAPRGAKIEGAAFAFSRPVPAAPRGLAVLVLDLDVLARSCNLCDVRLVDPEGFQVPYLAEQRSEPLVVRLAPPRRQERRSISIWSVSLPYDSLPPGTRLVLRTDARVFSRELTMVVPRANDRERHARVVEYAQWRSADPETAPPPLSLDVAGLQARRVELRVDEGDNTPLDIRSAELVVESTALRFHHPGVPLTLVYGNASAARPQYDLALIAPRLFGQPATELTLAPVHAPAETDAGRDHQLFWIGIAVAALVLLTVLVRVLRAAPVH